MTLPRLFNNPDIQKHLLKNVPFSRTYHQINYSNTSPSFVLAFENINFISSVLMGPITVCKMSEVSPWTRVTVHLYGLSGVAVILIATLFGALHIMRHFAEREGIPTSDAPPAVLQFYLRSETDAPPNETDGAPNEDTPLPDRARIGRCSDEELQEVADQISHVSHLKWVEEEERLHREELEEQRIEEEREMEEIERARAERERQEEE